MFQAFFFDLGLLGQNAQGAEEFAQECWPRVENIAIGRNMARAIGAQIGKGEQFYLLKGGIFLDGFLAFGFIQRCKKD